MTSAQIETNGLIAIIRTGEVVDLVSTGHALADGGVGAVEVTLNTPGALDAIGTLRSMLSILVGAGTILGVDDARSAHAAGAQFIVTPTVQPETIAFCSGVGLPIVCGCFTPTEALAAHQAGADFVKLFPADTLGPAYVRALLAPMPFLKIVPTGGVGLDNVAAYFKAGAVAVAVGSSLVDRRTLRDADWPALTNLARAYVECVGQARR